MPIAPAKFVPYEYKTSLIKITSYERKNPVGVLINPFFGEEKHFDNLTQLIFIMDELQNSLNFPQESMESRSLVKNTTPVIIAKTDKNADMSKPPNATFKINILFRHNASWQGGIVWVEQAKESQFRSVLELIMLIDSVLASE